MYKLAVSNIAWHEYLDAQVYEMMKEYGFNGLEIAPTRIFPKAPYDRPKEAGDWAKELRKQYGFSIPSIQSIWSGRTEQLFGTEEERKVLADYTKKAVDFAAAIDCKNLVFGCPRNRSVMDGADSAIGIRFFKEIGDYAYSKGTVIGMEANPPIYHTNFINHTDAALDLIRQVDSKGFLLNLDVGTMLYNEEPVSILKGRVQYISHVHISEPGLKPIVVRKLHKDLKELLEAEDYRGFISMEMGRNEDLSLIGRGLLYVRGVFG